MKIGWALCVCLVALAVPTLTAQSGTSGIVPYQPEMYNGIYEWRDAVFPGTYRKEPDGSLRRVERIDTFASFNGGGPTTTLVPVDGIRPVSAQDVEAYEREAAASGSAGDRRRPKPPAQSLTFLDGLIPGGQVRAQSALPMVKGRNLLLVLTAKSRSSFDAIDDMQRRVAGWGAAQKTPDVRAAAAALSSKPFKKSFAAGLVAVLRDTFAKVTVADDLSALTPPAFDYALVVDLSVWYSAGEPVGPALRGFSWVLLDSARDVVLAQPTAVTRVVMDGDALAAVRKLDEDTTSFLTFQVDVLRISLADWPTSLPRARAQAPPRSPQAVEPSAEPPLLPGEVYARTLLGCAIVQDATGATPGQREVIMNSIRQKNWYRTGTAAEACVNGLVTGLGHLATPADDRKWGTGFGVYEYAFGRYMGKLRGSGRVYYSIGGNVVVIPDGPDPFAPMWDGTALTSPGGTKVEAVSERCTSQKGCADKPFDRYGVKVTNKDAPTGMTTWCPDRSSKTQCEPLWQEKSGPVVASLKAFVVDAEERIAQRKRQYAELTARWVAARAEFLKDQRARTVIEFANRLEGARAGELFSIADQMAAARKPAESRQALRALVSRFPTHPLGVLAAKRLQALAK